MEQLPILRIAEHPEWKSRAGAWFHQVWGIPEEAYLESMDACLSGQSAVPQWYIVTDGDRIVAGLGVIGNDFHDRKDLTPNVCAVYVDKTYRCRGVAGRMLDHVCRDFHEKGIDTLYLLTDHDSFYERYGWTFFCMAQGDGETEPSRMYIHQS